MKSFTDKNGAQWVIDVNVASVKQVKALLKVDLMEIVGENTEILNRLYDDPILLVDLLFVLCQDQVKEKGLDDIAFATIFDGDTIHTATEALMEDLLNFFPPRRRELLAKMKEKFRLIEEAAVEKAAEDLDKIDIKSLMKDAAQQMNSGEPFTLAAQS